MKECMVTSTNMSNSTHGIVKLILWVWLTMVCCNWFSVVICFPLACGSGTSLQPIKLGRQLPNCIHDSSFWFTIWLNYSFIYLILRCTIHVFIFKIS